MLTLSCVCTHCGSPNSITAVIDPLDIDEVNCSRCRRLLGVWWDLVEKLKTDEACERDPALPTM